MGLTFGLILPVHIDREGEIHTNENVDEQKRLEICLSIGVDREENRPSKVGREMGSNEKNGGTGAGEYWGGGGWVLE